MPHYAIGRRTQLGDRLYAHEAVAECSACAQPSVVLKASLIDPTVVVLCPDCGARRTHE